MTIVKSKPQVASSFVEVIEKTEEQQSFDMKIPEMSADKQKVDLGLLEEDDEFEEFPTEHWGPEAEAEDEDVSVWEDNWEDDIVQDDFNQQLRQQLEKLKDEDMD